jgi:uncharacterized protein YfaS (alpha-2-macroglobulin family)
MPIHRARLAHPMMLKIHNPKNQVVHTELDRRGLAGHYAFGFATDDDDPTGRWFADLYNGGTLLGSHPLRVEMVAPNRLKVRLDLPKEIRPDTDGHADIDWRPPLLTEVPSALSATLTARVFERGGRPTTEAVAVPLDPYDAYVGLRKPTNNWAAPRPDRQRPAHPALRSRSPHGGEGLDPSFGGSDRPCRDQTSPTFRGRGQDAAGSDLDGDPGGGG